MSKVIFIILFISLPVGMLASEPATLFNGLFRNDIAGWIAADATYSILLPDGRTLWLFGDTFIGEVDGVSILPGSKFIRNSAVMQENYDLATLYGGTGDAPDDFIKTNEPDSTWYWPEHGSVIGDTLRILVSKFRHADNGTSGFDFEQIGNDIVSLTWPGLGFIRIDPVKAYEINGVVYGDRILADTNFIYIYGRYTDTAFYNIPYPHVARTSAGNFMDQSEWEYFDGSGWSADPADSRRINDFPVSQQYCVSTYRGKYILLTQNTLLSPDIYSFVSDSPVGPWENKTKIYTTPETGGSTFTYNAYAHPQFNKDQELLVSYNVNGDFWSVFSNVELYRPRFIRVPYMNLSYDFWPNSLEGQDITGKEVHIWPNPAVSYFMLSIDALPGSSISWSLMDLSGRIICNRVERSDSSGHNKIRVSLDSFERGIYLIRVETNDIQDTKYLIKSN